MTTALEHSFLLGLSEKLLSGPGGVRIFHQVDFDDPTYFNETTVGSDSSRLFTQKDLDLLREHFTIVKAIYV